MFSLIPLGIMILILGISVGISVIRGFAKSTIRLCTVLACAVLTVTACLIGKALLPNGVEFLDLVQNNTDLINQYFGSNAASSVTQIMEYAQISPSLIETLLQLSGALIAPLLCLLVFFVMSIVFGIVYLIALLIRRIIIKVRKKEKKTFSRVYAIGIGLVQGLVVIAILFIPFAGYLPIADSALQVMTEQEILDEEDPMIQTVQVAVKDFNESFTMKGYRILGGNLLTNAVMSMKVGNVRGNALDEIDAYVALADGALDIINTEDGKLDSEEAEIIRLMGNSFTKSKFLTPIAGEALHAATTAWMNGQAFCGMEKPSVGDYDPVVEPAMDVFIEILNTDSLSSESLQDDVLTIVEVGAIVVENEVLSHTGDTAALLSSLDNEVMVKNMVTTLGKNQSMKRLIPEVTNLGVRALGHFLNIPQNTQQVYNTFLNDVSDTLNTLDSSDPEQIKKISEQVNNAFDEAGVFIDDEIRDLYVASMIHDLVDNNPKGEVTPTDVQAFFIMYSQNMQSVLDGKTEEVSAGRPSLMPLNTTKNADIFAGSIYEGMTKEQKNQTAACVLASLCVSLTNMDAAAEDYSEQVKTLVVNTYSGVLSEGHAALEILKEIQVTMPVTTQSIQNAASMESLEKMEKSTVVITIDALLLDAKAAAENITAETIDAEAGVIVSIFSTAGNLAAIVGNGNEELDVQALAGSVGTILDSLKNTGTFGQDNTSKLFTAVMQSKIVREAADLDMKTATQMAEQATQGDGSYSELMGAVSGSLGILDKIQKNEQITNEEMLDFMKKLTPQSAGMFKVYISDSRLQHYGVPKQQSGVSAELLSSMFTYMSRDDIEDYDAEAEALTKLLQMSLNARDSKNKNLYSSEDGTVVGKLPTAKETISTILDSRATRYAIVDVMTDGQQVTRWDPMQLSEEIKTDSADYDQTFNAICDYRQEHNDQDQLLYEAIMALFGIQETID